MQEGALLSHDRLDVKNLQLLNGLGFLLCLTCGCTTSREERIHELRELPPIPFAIHVTAVREQEVGVGPTAEENGDIERTVEKMVADTLIACGVSDRELITFASDEDPRSDLRVELRITGPDISDGEISIDGALLEVLAWGVVPPAMYWIPDVEYDLGMEVKWTVGWARDASEASSEGLLEDSFSSESYRTNLLERRHVCSIWPYLCSIVVPPFVFHGYDEKRLEEILIGDLMSRGCLDLVREIKTKLASQELFNKIGIAVALDRCSPTTGEVYLNIQLRRDDQLADMAIWVNGEAKGALKPLEWKELKKISERSRHGDEKKGAKEAQSFEVGGLKDGRNVIRVQTELRSDPGKYFTFTFAWPPEDPQSHEEQPGELPRTE